MAQRFQQAISSHVSGARARQKNEKYLINLSPCHSLQFPATVATSNTVAGTRNIFLCCVVPLHLQPFLLPSPKLFPALTSPAKLSPSAFSRAWGNLFMFPRMSSRVNGVSIIVYHWIFSGEIENFAFLRACKLFRASQHLTQPEIERQMWPPRARRRLYSKKISFKNIHWQFHA